MSKNKKVKIKKTIDLDKPIIISVKDEDGYTNMWVHNTLFDGDVSQYINNPKYTVSN